MGKGMKAGKRPKAPGAGNMQKQMQQMQQMQRKMDELQAEISEMEATATSGGGAVTVTVSGKKEIKDMDHDRRRCAGWSRAWLCCRTDRLPCVRKTGQ